MEIFARILAAIIAVAVGLLFMAYMVAFFSTALLVADSYKKISEIHSKVILEDSIATTNKNDTINFNFGLYWGED